MPFLNLDDSQRFSNLGKIWIYAVTSVFTTVVTFLISIAWDRYPIGLKSATDSATDEVELVNNDVQVLEPTHHGDPDPKELMQQVMDILKKTDDDPQDSHDTLYSRSSSALGQNSNEGSNFESVER